MQSDLWSAFDAVSPFTRARGVDAPSREAATRLAERLARLIARIALTRAEIEHLPDNYAMARSSGALPDLFAPSGPWLEVEWGKDRLHDSDEGSKMRRAARVFVRPAKPPLDEGEFLRQLGHQSVALSMVALVEQILLVDRDSHVVPTPLVSEVQVRTFSRDARGELLSTTFEQFEISRRLMRLQPLSGGFVRLEGRDPAYLPTSGNDYGFASPDFTMSAEQAPVLGTLRTRCSACHGANGSYLMSFSRIDGDSLPPPVRFPQPNDRRGRYVAEKKERRTDFADLIALTRASGR
jgi:hypothetical protein